MSALLLLFLSAVVLRSVSAGGAYCAKTAQARAAALGLDYPGVSGAPDLSGPAHHGMPLHHSTMPVIPQPYQDHELAETATSMAQNRPNPRRMRPEAYRLDPHSRFESTFLQSRSPYHPDYTADQVHSPPRGHSLINHKPNFEQVKHIAPEAPGPSDLVNQDPQGRSRPPSYVHNRPDLVVDESVPNRRGMSLTGLPLPRSRGHTAHQRGSSPGREVPVLGSTGVARKEHGGATSSRGRGVRRLKMMRFPGHRAQMPLNRGFRQMWFTGRKPVRYERKLKMRSIRKKKLN